MTRINVGIRPEELTTKHLIAEHREIKRIPNCIKIGRYSLKGQPSEFKLGTGHIKFFYNKLEYLRKRYEEIYLKCGKRNFNVTYYGESFKNLPIELMNDYKETERDRRILQERINERLNIK